jgi:hypothetical protein
VSATGAVGTVSAGTELLVNVTGVFSTASVGQAEAISSVNALATGISAAGEVGIAIGAVESDALLTGVSSTGSIGTAVVTGTANIVATGVSAQANVGSVGTQIGGNTSFTAVGVSANASIGNVTVSLFNNVAVNLTGVSSTASAGTLVVLASARTTLSGVSATALLGTFTARTSVVNTVSGIQASASVGSVQVTTQQTTAVTGVAASGQVSGVTVNVTAFVSVNATGVAATGSVGSVFARTSDSFIVLSTNTSPYLHAYEWDDASGFGAKFSDPASLPAGGVSGVAIKPKQTGETVRYVAAAINASADPRVWQLDGITGWGSAITMSGGGNRTTDVAWLSYGSPATEWLVAGNALSGASRLRAKQFAAGAFTGSTQSDSNTTNNVLAVTALPLSNTVRGLVSGRATSTHVVCSDFTTVFTGDVSGPAVQAPGIVNGITNVSLSVGSNPRGVIFAAHDSSPYISAWPIEVNGFDQSQFGTKYSNPSTLPAGNGNGVAFRQTSGNAGQIAVAHDTSPRISVYAWNAGFGTKYSDPATLPTGSSESAAFNSNGSCIAVGHATSPYISVYPWDTSTGFGTKFFNPSTAMTATVQSVKFS